MTPENEISIRPLFATPLLVFTVVDHRRINAELSRLILERETSQPSYSDDEVVGWSSPHDLSMLEWAADPLELLLGQVTQVATCMTELSERSSLHARQPEWRVAELWANVQRKGGSNACHPHPGSFWSGVYYIDVGDVSQGANGGELQLYDPRGCLPRMLAPYLRYSVPELHDAGASVSFTPSAGQCLLFPGWLFHAVTRYTGNAPRISIAFNLDPIIHKGS
ncbi:2OG-Fe(II) oxygenase family protein [Nitrospira sp. KM1]|uniref:2OG-Fe(II) oxygenase family protein n=1 Tax=Nitrospira sp. KM1 TaxID=1936990 RepID=UPI0015677104|nr:2OG-Fe(II) oxygenase family protein [Nitrospira sp. KM1]